MRLHCSLTRTYYFHFIESTLNRHITPLPLINGQPPDTWNSSSGHSGGQSSGSSSQSSKSSVNNLGVDEKHFLNEIVKNFNKSILGYSDGHHVSTIATNETLSPTNPFPKRDYTNDTSLEPSSTLATLRAHARPASVADGFGFVNRNALPKTYYHKTDSAMLNYLFDSHVKLRHSDLRSVEITAFGKVNTQNLFPPFPADLDRIL